MYTTIHPNNFERIENTQSPLLSNPLNPFIRAQTTNLAPASLDRSRRASGAAGAGADLGGLGAVVVALVEPAEGAAHDARVGDGGRVAVVDVDARHDLAAADLDVAEGALARVLRVAVAARPVQLADAAGEEVLDCHRAAAVVLQHLVIGTTCAATVDVRRPRGLLEGRCVLAYVGPPAVNGTCC